MSTTTANKHLTKVMEKYGMYGMSRAELQRMAKQHRDKKSLESKRITTACDRIILWKRMCGFE